MFNYNYSDNSIRVLDLEYTRLGKTDLKISRIGLGAWEFSPAWGIVDYNMAKSVIVEALNNGINFFDTAMVYGNGMSERFLGKSFRELGVRRDDIVIATKIPGDYLDEQDVFKAVYKSLRNLDTSYIDLLQIHWPPCWHNHSVEEYARSLEKLVDLGLVRYIGVSNHPILLIEDLRSSFSKIDIVSMQYRYNLVERKAERELIPYAERNGFTFIPWSPLAKGALTGKYTFENLPKFQDVRGNDPTFHPENFKKIEPLIILLRELSEKYGKKPGQIALNWLIMRSDKIVPIPGAKTPEQVRDNAESIGWKLSIDDWLKINEVSNSIRIDYTVYYEGKPMD